MDDCWRDDFLDFGGVSYLNCAYHGPLPRVAVEAAQEALRMKALPFLIRDELHFTFPDEYREAVAILVGCDPHRVVVADSTTHGVMILVQGLDWRAGDEVVVPAGSFPSNRFPWKLLERRGVVVHEIEIAGGEHGAAQVVAAIGPRTRVVSVAGVSYQSGLRRDLGAIGNVCQERGVLFAVDGSQQLGGLPFDLRETPCDLLACSGYKWLLGPYGLGFAVLSAELCERLAVGNVNWLAIDGARDFNRLSRCELRFVPGAMRFDINETANFTNLAAGTASLRFLARVTPAAAARHARALLDRLMAGLPAGFQVVSSVEPAERSNLLFVAAESQAATATAHRRLAEQRISVSLREGCLRISPHLHNDGRDVDRLLEVLAR